MEGLKKLKCKKEYGEYHYRKVTGEDLDAPIYELYDKDGQWVQNFAYYGDMKYYIETGVII